MEWGASRLAELLQNYLWIFVVICDKLNIIIYSQTAALSIYQWIKISKSLSF